MIQLCWRFSREQRRDDHRFFLLAGREIPHQLAPTEPLRDVFVGPHTRLGSLTRKEEKYFTFLRTFPAGRQAGTGGVTSVSHRASSHGTEGSQRNIVCGVPLGVATATIILVSSTESWSCWMAGARARLGDILFAFGRCESERNSDVGKTTNYCCATYLYDYKYKYQYGYLIVY